MLNHRCGNGKLFMYGCSNDGRLGVALNEKSEETNQDDENWKMETKGLQKVVFPDPKLIVAKVECGSSFTLVLSSTGLLFSWGFGKSGSLGLGEKSNCKTPLRIEKTFSNANCENIVDISCGSSHSLAIDNAGNIYSWGNGQGGRLGHNQEVGENLPRIIEELQGRFIKVIEAGDASSACITHDSIVFMWGSGLNGRLGNGSLNNCLVPEISMELKKKQVKQIIKGTNSTFSILESGKVFGWGSSKNGKLGLQLPQGKNYELPREIVSLEGKEIYQIASGPFHTLCLTMQGELHVMGNSKDGKLGILVDEGSVHDVELPEPVYNSMFNHEDKSDKMEITFFQHKTVKTITKQYALFDDYDEFARLRPLVKKDIPYEVIQIKCGQNF
jgi:alpha-tubulin suppressor-like RCC1 family protein